MKKTINGQTMTITYPEDFLSLTKSERCIGQVRWVPLSAMQAGHRKLQQLWEITSYKDGKPWSLDHEWRDVPFDVE